MSANLTRSPVALLALLTGMFLSAISASAMADASTDYQNKCAKCHGAPAPGSIRLSQFPTTSELAGYIDVYMPKDNPSDCKGTCAQSISGFLNSTISNAPIAKAGGMVTVGTAPLLAKLNGFGSTNADRIVSYDWNFGDGQSGKGDMSNLGMIEHTYMANGTYPATLTVKDAQGRTSISTISVYVVKTHTPPVINTSKSSGLSGVSPVTTVLDASLSTCTGVCSQFYWAFDDGSDPIYGASVTHTFNTVGTHIVNLNVMDGGADSSSVSTTTLTVTVTKSSVSPVADAGKSKHLIGAMTLFAQFDGSLSNCANSCSYSWNFGDSTALGSGPLVTHPYTKVSDYTATLTVTDKSNGKTNSTTLPVKVVPAESLTDYVQACRDQLGFRDVPIPDFDCYDGDLFATPADFNKNGAVRDFVGNTALTDQVDATFACRWLSGDKTNRQNPISVEMLVHNRQNGNTCFFSAKGKISGDSNPISSLITSPTSTNANAFWDQPATVDDKVRCIGCHVSGPYITTPTIAPYLAKFGLLNNGHDTLSNVSVGDLSTPNKNVKYHAISGKVNNVPGAFSPWDSLKQSYINPTASSCSSGCHMIGTSSPQDDVHASVPGDDVILTNPSTQLYEIHHYFVMKPYDDGNDYRWINLDSAGDGVEKETFEAAINATTTLVPKLFSAENGNCPQPNVPNVMEAHVAGSTNTFLVAQPDRFAFLADRLSVFNLKQGLVCLNADQETGTKCQDYKVSYECTAKDGTKAWVSSPNRTPQSDGDHEERPANVCATNSTATAIKAEFTAVNGWTYSSIGPNDRLASFSQYGLTCNNSNQPDGKCSNYVVRYSSCAAPPPTLSNKTLTNRNVTAGSKQLTAAANSWVKGQAHNNAWNTQAWTIEPIPNTEYVRVRIPNANVYLNVSSQIDPTAVSTATLNTGWTSEMWLIEPISGSTDVRLKNLWTGLYLTMADPNTVDATLKDYLPLYSQKRNTGWNTQRWVIQ